MWSRWTLREAWYRGNTASQWPFCTSKVHQKLNQTHTFRKSRIMTVMLVTIFGMLVTKKVRWLHFSACWWQPTSLNTRMWCWWYHITDMFYNVGFMSTDIWFLSREVLWNAQKACARYIFHVIPYVFLFKMPQNQKNNFRFLFCFKIDHIHINLKTEKNDSIRIYVVDKIRAKFLFWILKITVYKNWSSIIPTLKAIGFA